MLRAIKAVVIVGAAWAICLGAAINASAQGAPAFVASAVDLEIVPTELANFIAALKENGAATITEPGCRRYDILQSTTNPNQIFIYEVYANEAAVKAHRATDHFKKYISVTKDMVAKRQSRPMAAVASYSK